ncbi:hypothetical protein NPIL_297141 [Nephila pilipes]|uniref:Uncharacterized protein n=1 Tax=Nephila pilipes TaxID=299642 RepID=A0A8X6UMG0_NEPPI|nr:hypothetical protein NPIL_297141 [Nephila pilipes]
MDHETSPPMYFSRTLLEGQVELWNPDVILIEGRGSKSKREYFNDDSKVDTFFLDDAIPLHRFQLVQDIYITVTYFATTVQVHLR